jgi:GNAT superfamily N-acetyltransferase
MSEILTRNPRANEISLLKNIWSSVFGDIGIDTFFALFFDPELCVVVEQGGSISAMGYLLPSGDIISSVDAAENETPVNCAMIYSVGTLPDYRGLGLGTLIVNNLISLACDLGYDAVILCPSEEGLFEYYKTRTTLRDWFYVSESVFSNPPIGTPSVLPKKISIDEYLTFREMLLTDIVHIKQNEKHFMYQLELCNELGGGLFRIGDSCAVVERQSNGVVWVKELLTPDNCKKNLDNHSISKVSEKISTPIAHMFPAVEYLVRIPAKAGAGRRFGMLSLCGKNPELSETNETAPWYGMAFD